MFRRKKDAEELSCGFEVNQKTKSTTMRKTTSQADLEEEASKKQSMSKCPQKNSTHFKKAQLLLFNYTKGIFLRKYFLNSPFILITSIKEQ